MPRVFLSIMTLESQTPLCSSGLRSCQVVIACLSDEYAASDNCQMELQFANKALRKPIIPGFLKIKGMV